MAGTKRKTDAEVEAVNQIYEVAEQRYLPEIERLKKEVEVKGDQREAIGILKSNGANRRFTELVDVIVLYRVKTSKSYKEGGLTWEEFCESAGIERRRADEIISDIRPVMERFSADFASLAGMELNKIRYLGRAISADSASFEGDALIIDGEKIPKEEIPAAIENLMDQIKKKDEELKGHKKASEKVQKGLHDQLLKTHRDYDKLKKKKIPLAEEQNLSEDEFVFIKKMEGIRMMFDTFYMKNLEPEQMLEFLNDEKETVRMRTAYLTTLDYLKKQLLAAWDTAEGMYCDASMNPDIAYIPEK